MIRFILTDIEGTTTSISFVHEVLFPYAAKHLRAYVEENQEREEVEGILEGVAATLKTEAGIENPDLKTLIDTLLHWIETDRKHTSLKELQGQLWKKGYENGDFLSHVYADVPGALNRWFDAGIWMGVYSSGSVEAQKLLYKNTIAGDLSWYFSFHFDTRIGHKREVESYQKIVKEIRLWAGDVLFLSDVPEELDAAQAAGLQVTQLLRPGIPPSDRHPGVSSFDEIQF